jgi:hypothetical protein
MADSLRDVSTEERELVRKGSLGLQVNMEEEKFITRLEFPFTEPGQIIKLDQLSARVIQQAAKKQMSAMASDSTQEGLPGGAEIPNASIDEYFVTTYSKNRIEKKLLKEKYEGLENDESMKALKEMSSMGIGNNTLVINLPRPATKAEGKNLTLSDDKKKITIITKSEDFFEDATALEYTIEF